MIRFDAKKKSTAIVCDKWVDTWDDADNVISTKMQDILLDSTSLLLNASP